MSGVTEPSSDSSIPLSSRWELSLPASSAYSFGSSTSMLISAFGTVSAVVTGSSWTSRSSMVVSFCCRAAGVNPKSLSELSDSSLSLAECCCLCLVLGRRHRGLCCLCCLCAGCGSGVGSRKSQGYKRFLCRSRELPTWSSRLTSYTGPVPFRLTTLYTASSQ